MTEIKFKVFNLLTGKIITDGSEYQAWIENIKGVGTVRISTSDLMVIPASPFLTKEGEVIFDGDIVEARVKAYGSEDDMTDVVRFNGVFWTFGTNEDWDEVEFKKIKGSSYEIPWPENRKAL